MVSWEVLFYSILSTQNAFSPQVSLIQSHCDDSLRCLLSVSYVSLLIWKGFLSVPSPERHSYRSLIYMQARLSNIHIEGNWGYFDTRTTDRFTSLPVGRHPSLFYDCNICNISIIIKTEGYDQANSKQI